MVKYLVSLGADIRSKNDYAVKYASLNCHHEVVKYLVSLGADIQSLTPKHQKYILFCKKTRLKAQKKIYFWWIQICYDPQHPSGCGKRMQEKSWLEFDKIQKKS